MRRFLWVAVLALAGWSLSASVAAQEPVVERFPCENDAGDQTLSPEAISQAIADHEAWLRIAPPDESVNESFALCGADLYEAELAGKNLHRASLRGADLDYADLTEANLSLADLSGANFAHADLTDANLTGSDLTEATFAQTTLVGANVAGAVFEPVAWPDPLGLVRVKGLSDISLERQVGPAVELRNTFRDSGFRSLEKAITSALAKHKLSSLDGPDRFFQRYVAGGQITDFGANPWGTLVWLGIFAVLFFWPYLFALRFNTHEHGIWLVRPGNRVYRRDDESNEELIEYRGFAKTIPLAFYFSILSAFHFGWRELNLGNWIARLQFRESTLIATGWVRSVSGVQSLLSLYLVALFLLSYFGDPYA